MKRATNVILDKAIILMKKKNYFKQQRTSVWGHKGKPDKNPMNLSFTASMSSILQLTITQEKL